MLSFAVRRLRQAWLPRVLPRLWAARPTVATAALAPIDRFRRNVAKPLDSDFQPVHARFGVLRPLKSLGGLSLVCYMAIEATEGHFQLYRTWRADVAQDLARALDRVEELELLVQDLTTMTLEDSQSQDAPAVVKPRLANSEIRTMNQRKKLRVEPSDDDDDNNDDDEEEEEDGEDSDYQSGQDEPSDVDDSQDSQDSREESQ